MREVIASQVGSSGNFRAFYRIEIYVQIS